MNTVFYCKNKQLARYLEDHGSKLVGTSVIGNAFVYVFERDETIAKNLKLYEEDKKKCMF